jgi:hypothetical protein
MVGGTAVVSTTQAAAGPVVSMTQTRPPRFTKSSAMARPSALGREPRS